MLKRILIFIFSCLFLLQITAQENKEGSSIFIGYEKYKNTNLIKAYDTAKEALEKSKKLQDSALIAKSYYNISQALYKQRKIEASEKAIESCFNYFTNKNDSILGLIYVSKANIERRKNNFEESLQNLKKAQQIVTINGFENLDYEIKISESVLFRSTKSYERSKKILIYLIEDEKNKNYDVIGAACTLLGISYQKTKRDSSVFYYKKAIRAFKKTNNIYEERIANSNLGNLLIKQKEYNQAFFYLNEAEEQAKKINDLAALFFLNISFAYYYEQIEDYEKAINKYKEAEAFEKYVDGNKRVRLYWLISGAYWHDKEFEKAYDYQEKLIYLKDSLFTIDKNKTFEKLQTEFEVEKKNTQIQLLEKEKELEANRKKSILGIGGLLLAVLGLLVFVYRNKVRSEKLIREKEHKLFQQEKAQLEQDQKIKRIEGYIEGEEKEKNRIAMELHDGIGGQLSGIKHYIASLPKNEETKVVLSNVGLVSQEVRLLSHSLSSNFSSQQSFTTLLQTLQQQYKNHFEIEFVLFPEEEIDEIDKEKKLFLYRTLQEVLNNTYKHANANSVFVNLTITDEIVLIVEDNGKGFSKGSTPNGIGLQNIQEKLKTFNGTFDIDATEGKGTTVIIKLPK